ncbi:hypothetical protein [Tetragenococcus halophilus]|uniref:hypothetical protein n=1 Tax=Tetragenococcus halophilus TaxID=51669 RepID=UPI0025B122A1|nr:hypothetical protein [Tetragenococcus halophilus]WJS82732.1 hypothetical protein KFZ55_04090 [Tetragenococcus halophilus]
MTQDFKDTPSAKEIAEQGKALKLLGPLLDGVGKESAEEIKERQQKAENMIEYVDNYNSLFSDNGWIAHELISDEAMKKAIDTYNVNGMAEAEEYLTNYYETKFEELFKMIKNYKYFNERKELLEAAYEDFQEARYYSSIPLMLMIVDGIVSDIKGTGLAASRTDYSVWDSISGVDSGLGKVAKIYNSKRTKTNKNEITLPYRNGILHGKDLNYANRLLATKCLALILFIFDWSRQVNSEDYRKNKFQEDKEKANNFSFKDIRQRQKDNVERDKLLETWKEEKRSAFEISNPDINDLDQNSPEYAVMKFLEYINDEDYGTPTTFLPGNVKSNQTKGRLAGFIKNCFNEFSNINIQKLEINDCGAVRTKINIKLSYYYQNKKFEQKDELLVNYEVDGEINNRLVPGGTWVIIALGKFSDKMKSKSKETTS